MPCWTPRGQARSASLCFLAVYKEPESLSSIRIRWMSPGQSLVLLRLSYIPTFARLSLSHQHARINGALLVEVSYCLWMVLCW